VDVPFFRLHINPAEGPAFDHVLRGDSLVVGRASDADLMLSDPFLSRRHTRFFRAGPDLFLEDLGSRNGTLLNDQLVLGPTRLLAGDVVRISNSVIAVEQGSPAPVPPAPDSEIVDELHDDGTIFLRASDLLDRQSATEPEQLWSEADLTRYAERLKLLNTVHQALGRSLDLGKLLELILDLVFDHLRPDRGAILLRAGSDFRPAASRSATGSAADLRFSRSLIREVTEKGMAALVLDVAQDERFAKSQSMLISGIRSLVAAPLLDPEGTLGMIVLESRIQTRQFKEEDLELLVSLASVAALHLRNLELALEAVERRRLEEELALARRIQVALLPAQLPDVPGWDLHGDNFPSRGVSGDYYEVIERRGGQECVLIVADVSGKGMAASLLTVSLQALSASPIEDGLLTDEICARLSRQLYRRTPPEKYATAFLAILEPATGRISYTNAGHNAGLVVRAGGAAIETLEANGVPLGLLPVAPPYRAAEVVLQPGDTLVLYTDGIVEAVDPDGQEFGMERLQDVCRRHCAGTCQELADAVEKDLAAFVRGVPFPDDRTIVTARRLA
jgi:sigma-B regulation protein RsbU (phosphoserine phosphatase)